MATSTAARRHPTDRPLASRPGLGHDAQPTARSLAHQSEMLLEENHLFRRSRRELSDLLYSPGDGSDSMTDTSADSAADRAEDRDTEVEGVASYLFEMGMLKNARRTGWWIPG